MEYGKAAMSGFSLNATGKRNRSRRGNPHNPLMSKENGTDILDIDVDIRIFIRTFSTTVRVVYL